MKLEKKDLLLILKVLASKINSETFLEMDLDDEKYYWEIPEDSIFEVFKGDPSLSIGDIKADWEELLRIKDLSETPISYDLKRLSIILQFVRIKSRAIW